MTSTVTPYPSSSTRTLETAYQIGKFIQSFVARKVEEGAKPRSDYPGHFDAGPNPFYNQTKKGLVLESCHGIPSRIHTSYGRWSILGNGSEDWDNVFETLKEPLGLVLLKDGGQDSIGHDGPFWAIGRWDGKRIEMPENKNRADYIPYEEVKDAWELFASEHPDSAQSLVLPHHG